MIEKGYIKWFSEIGLNSKKLVGEKAAYLSEIYNKKILTKNVEIPEGFVITKNAIKEFFEEKNINNAIQNIFGEINYNNSEELERGIKQLKQLIIRTSLQKELLEEISDSYETLGLSKLEIQTGSAYDILSNAQEPSFVAVRASNDIAESYFNVKGISEIINSIKKVLISLFTKENLRKNHLEKINFEQLYEPIIIQRMIQSDKSGTVFVKDKYNIQAIWGLGTGLHQKEIGKDFYIVRRDSRILSKDIKEKKYAITRDSSGTMRAIQLKEGYSFSQVLTTAEIQSLSDATLRLEDIFTDKIQFDFAIENDIIYIVKIEKLSKDSNFENSDAETEPPKEIEKEITKALKKPKTVIQNLEPKNQKQTSIFQISNTTKTKISLLIETKEDSEKGKKTLIKTAFLPIEKIIKMRGLHPKTYIENFNTKGYGEVIESGLYENSKEIEKVWISLSDFTTEEFKNLEGSEYEREDNPLMGLCGIRFLLSYPELLKRELEAIGKLKKEGKEIGVLIPKISSVYELKKVKEFLKELNLELKIGIILEIPASIQLIKDFIEEGIDAAFFSGDKLTQYLLGIDRNNKNVKNFYDNTNPALMYQLEYVIRVCKRKNVETFFFGEATNNKEMIEYLVKKEISSIITTPENANKIEEEIKNAEKKSIEGTDKEPRKYEIVKEKERQKKELKEFEQNKKNQAKKEAEIYSNRKREQGKEIETIKEPIEKNIKLIEKEKEEYENETIKDIPEKEIETIKEPIEKNIKLIEKEKEEYENKEKEQVKEKSIETPEKFLNPDKTAERNQEINLNDKNDFGDLSEIEVKEDPEDFENIILGENNDEEKIPEKNKDSLGIF